MLARSFQLNYCNMKTTKNHKVSVVNFIGTLLVNVDNEKLSDAEFRQVVRNTLSIVEKPARKEIANEEMQEKIRGYYINEIPV